MSPQRHPEDETLLDYAMGGLPPGASLIIRVHLEYCAHCRSTARFLDLVGGAVLGGIAPEPASADVIGRTIAALDSQTPEPAATPPRRLTPGEIIAAIPHSTWSEFCPGVELAPVHGRFDPHETVCLLRGKAGAKVPTHGHETVERFIVLQGEYGLDSTVYYAGDYVDADASIIHTPFVPWTSDCICLFALEDGLTFPDARPAGPSDSARNNSPDR